MDKCFLVEIWLVFQSRYLLVWVGFLYTQVCMVWSKFGEHLVSKNEMLQKLPGASIVNLM